jgi:hypothetical protein
MELFIIVLIQPVDLLAILTNIKILGITAATIAMQLV